MTGWYPMDMFAPGDGDLYATPRPLPAAPVDLCVECGAPMLTSGARCVNGCHVFIQAPDGAGECVNCLRAVEGLDPLAPHEFVIDDNEDVTTYWGNP